MAQQAADRANGVPQDQETDIVQQLLQARKAATVTTMVGGSNVKPGHAANPADFTGAGGAPRANAAFRNATKQLGQNYVWGGESRKEGGFDCSGLIQWAYGAAGIKLPRTAAEQGRIGRAVPYNKLKRGDLLVENNGGHVVMYAGNGKVIAAPHTGTVVKYEPLSYFTSDNYHARRVVG